MKNRIGSIKILIAIFCFVLSFLLLFSVFDLVESILDGAESGVGSPTEQISSGSLGERIQYDGKWYERNDLLESFLILGIDKRMDGSEDRENSEQSDFLMLVLLNKKEKSYTFLHLNRDTMTDIPVADAFGEVYGHTKGQLTLAHTVGATDKERCRNSVDAVETLLHGINIDHYLSLTMDAVAIVNDSIGGVTVQLMDDFTDLDETFEKGAVVTLKGEQALTYVRARASLEDSTNLHRMERQKQYIASLLNQISTYDVENNTDTMLKVSEYVVSDCTMDQLSKLFERLKEYQYNGVISPAGEAVKGAEFMEFHVDDEALMAMVVDLFYENKE